MLARGVPSRTQRDLVWILTGWRKAITYGLQGLNYYQVEVKGPSQDLRSGVFGGAVPNPITILTEAIAKLRDKNFRVCIPGFYDDVDKISPSERRAIRSLPWKEKELRKTVGSPDLCGEKGYSILARLWCRHAPDEHISLDNYFGGIKSAAVFYKELGSPESKD